MQIVSKKHIYIPTEFADVYGWQEKNLRIDKITDPENYKKQKRQFLSSQAGKQFLQYKKEKFTNLHGLEIWFIEGTGLRTGLRIGDVDFTMGGHGFHYFYIPFKEIWIDKIFKDSAELWSIVWHEYVELGLMEKGMSYNNAHSIASDLEIVLKAGKYFILPVGNFRQNTPWTCGPAALKIVLDFFRLSFSEEYLAKLCQADADKGADPKDLVKAAEKLGLKAYEKQKMTVIEVKKLIGKGVPVIANYQYTPEYGEGHYAVVIGFSKTEFILSDPAKDEGYQKVRIKDFMKQWYELEDKTVCQGIVVTC